ncbi:hypothetical protein JYB64_21065 [Algoriphagus aestuarii]|nr:hypothetical protein [Algoriphagus aestuarii]
MERAAVAVARLQVLSAAVPFLGREEAVELARDVVFHGITPMEELIAELLGIREEEEDEEDDLE